MTEAVGEYTAPYGVACIQNRPRIVADLHDKDAVIGSNMERMLELIDYATDWGKSGVRLVVAPEYALNGPARPIPGDVETLIATGVTIPGKWTDMLADKAAERNVYIAANLLEVDPEWPGRFFNTTFIISPKREIILKHWKNNHNAAHNPYTTPADVYDDFVRKYGQEMLFPVVETEIGKLGAITCCECYFAELVRCTVLNGAEVIVGPTASQLIPGDKHKIPMIQGHCMSMSTHWVRANIGGFVDSVVPEEHYVGQSVIIDHEGNELVKSSGAGEVTVRATINLNAQRELRDRSGRWGTFRSEMIGREFMRHAGWPNNRFLDEPIKSLSETKQVRREVVEEMYERGTLTRPFQPAKDLATRAW